MHLVSLGDQPFQAFVEAGGYQDRAYWDDEGWAWREQVQTKHPVACSRVIRNTWFKKPTS